MTDPKIQVVLRATETGTPPPNRNEVGDRIILAKVVVKVNGAPTTCYLYAEEYDSDNDPLECETCEGEGCDECENTGYADANAWSVALGVSPDAAHTAHSECEDAHYVAPCWCGNDATLEDRAEWLRWQAEDAGLTPCAGGDAEPEIVTKHTPGPWAETYPKSGDIKGADGLDVAHVFFVGDVALIAAAPELRDMVRDLRDFITLADKENRDMRKRMDALLKKVGAWDAGLEPAKEE
jgi:hypothetical protein